MISVWVAVVFAVGISICVWLGTYIITGSVAYARGSRRMRENYKLMLDKAQKETIAANQRSHTNMMEAYRANKSSAKLANKIHRQRLTIKYLKQFAPKKQMVN